MPHVSKWLLAAIVGGAVPMAAMADVVVSYVNQPGTCARAVNETKSSQTGSKNRIQVNFLRRYLKFWEYTV